MDGKAREVDWMRSFEHVVIRVNLAAAVLFYFLSSAWWPLSCYAGCTRDEKELPLFFSGMMGHIYAPPRCLVHCCIYGVW